MSDHVIDTNVLLVASAAHPFSPFDDSDLPFELRERVLEWLVAFRADPDSRMVWDDAWRIYDEYRHKLTDQDYGLLVVNEKMQSARFVPVSYDDGGAARVPPEFARFDRSDRKFLAALLNDQGQSSLVNAADTDWLEIEEELDAAGVEVEHLLEDWLRDKHFAKRKTA